MFEKWHIPEMKTCKWIAILLLAFLVVSNPESMSASRVTILKRKNPPAEHEYQYADAYLPKLALTADWLSIHPKLALPGALKGQTISVLGSLDGVTLIADSADRVHEIAAEFCGGQSEFLKKYAAQGKAMLASLPQATPDAVNLPQFETMHIPPFQTFSGPFFIKGDADGGSGGSFLFRGGKKLIFSARFRWEKRKLWADPAGKAFATFIIPASIKNESSEVIANFSARFFLAGADGQKYYAAERAEIAALRSMPPNSAQENWLELKIKAPADDFSMRLFIDIEDQPPFSPGGFNPGETIPAELQNDREGQKNKLLALSKYLEYCSSREGYDRLLGKIAVLHTLQGHPAEALVIIDKLASTVGDSVQKNKLRLTKIAASLNLGLFHSALLELREAQDSDVPAFYREYLILHTLPLLERMEALEAAARKPENSTYREKLQILKNKGLKYFLNSTIVTPLISPDLAQKTKVPATTREKYELAAQFYLHNDFGHAKTLLLDVLKTGAGDIVEKPDRWKLKAGLGALDMLFNIYFEENNIPEAMKCSQRMIDEYLLDEYQGPYEGEGYYGGPGGAQGLVYQMGILTNRVYGFDGSETKIAPDYDRAIALAHTLINKFDGKMKPCWEDCSNYEEAAIWYIQICLQGEKAPLSKWEKEIRAAISETKNKPLQADLLLGLGEKSLALGNQRQAIGIYNEVIKNYSEVYKPIDYSCDVRIPFIDAFEVLLKISRNKPEAEETRNKLKVHCQKMRAILIQDGVFNDSCLDGRYMQYIKKCR